MDGKYLFLAELLITLGLVFGIGLWQLRQVNKKLREGESETEKAESEKDPG